MKEKIYKCTNCGNLLIVEIYERFCAKLINSSGDELKCNVCGNKKLQITTN